MSSSAEASALEWNGSSLSEFTNTASGGPRFVRSDRDGSAEIIPLFVFSEYVIL